MKIDFNNIYLLTSISKFPNLHIEKNEKFVSKLLPRPKFDESSTYLQKVSYPVWSIDNIFHKK